MFYLRCLEQARIPHQKDPGRNSLAAIATTVIQILLLPFLFVFNRIQCFLQNSKRKTNIIFLTLITGTLRPTLHELSST